MYKRNLEALEIPTHLTLTQGGVPCTLMRGGTSRGPFFVASDLPNDEKERNEILLRAIGNPAFRRVDGIGGMDAVTSKLAIVSRSEHEGADVDYLFAQADTETSRLDFAANCGNLMSAVGPFALERGLVQVRGEQTVVRIRNVNTGVIVHAMVQTPAGRVAYGGDCEIDGVPGQGAPIALNFLDAVGSKTGKLFPTGNRKDFIDGLAVSCVDVGVPVVFLYARSLAKTGYELPEELNGDKALMTRLERIRLEAGQRMGLGDCRGSVVPKICLIAPPRDGGYISSRYFTPKSCHPSHAVTGALCLTVASMIQGTIVEPIAEHRRRHCEGGVATIEHPSGKIQASVAVEQQPDGGFEVTRAAFVRTADRLFDGRVILRKQG